MVLMQNRKWLLIGGVVFVTGAHAAMAQTNQNNNSPAPTPTQLSVGETYLKSMIGLGMPEIYAAELAEKCGAKSKGYADDMIAMWWEVVSGAAAGNMYARGYKGPSPDQQFRPIFERALKKSRAEVQQAPDKACAVFKDSNFVKYLDDAFNTPSDDSAGTN